jgi:hypothetical protein
LSKTPYATGPKVVEEVEVNPSASLNEWLVPPLSSSQELKVTSLFWSYDAILFIVALFLR